MNDTFGHVVGDTLLRAVGELLARNTRPSDLVARIGGDEFLIVIANMNSDLVRPVVDRIVASVSDQVFMIEGKAVRVGASIGYACCPEDDLSVAALRLKADHALYAAKRRGKGVGLRFGAEILAAA